MTAFWETLSVHAPSFMNNLIQHELQILLFVLIVFVIDVWLRQTTPKFRYLLWMLVLARALWPPFLPVPQVSLLPVEVIEIPILGAPFPSTSPILQDGFHPDLSTVLVLMWSGASMILALVMVMGFISFRLRLRNSEALPREISKSVSSSEYIWPPVYVSDGVESPVTAGLLRPRIYLTTAAAQSKPKTLRAILHHELAHVLRRDGWVGLLQGLVLILHPLNPLVWVMNRNLSRYREQSCDDFALQKSAMEPNEYGHMLLGQLHMNVIPALYSRPCFLETKQSLRQRLNNVMNWKENNMNQLTRRKRTMILGGLMISMVLIASQCEQGSEPLGELGIQQSPPPPPEMPEMKSVPYDTPPKPIGGFGAIQQHLHYPEEARQDGVEGMVVLQLQVLASGKTGNTVSVLANKAGDGRLAKALAQAAIDALRNVQWEPATFEGEPVSVWIAIPINFKLPD